MENFSTSVDEDLINIEIDSTQRLIDRLERENDAYTADPKRGNGYQSPEILQQLDHLYKQMTYLCKKRRDL